MRLHEVHLCVFEQESEDFKIMLGKTQQNRN